MRIKFGDRKKILEEYLGTETNNFRTLLASPTIFRKKSQPKVWFRIIHQSELKKESEQFIEELLRKQEITYNQKIVSILKELKIENYEIYKKMVIDWWLTHDMQDTIKEKMIEKFSPIEILNFDCQIEEEPETIGEYYIFASKEAKKEKMRLMLKE